MALIEDGMATAPAAAQGWLGGVVRFARRALARGVGITFVIDG